MMDQVAGRAPLGKRHAQSTQCRVLLQPVADGSADHTQREEDDEHGEIELMRWACVPIST